MQLDDLSRGSLPDNINTTGRTIRAAIIGVGNCASSLVQGVEFFRNVSDDAQVSGPTHANLGGYRIRDIKFTAAFDVNSTKVGLDLAEAICAEPNNSCRFASVPPLGVKVHRGKTHDGLGKHLKGAIVKAPGPPDDIVGILKDTRTDVVINYLPAGSEMATKWYVEQVLDAGCAFINCVPVFIASQPYWHKRFQDRGVPVIGDDIKSQVGATITHGLLATLFLDRGVQLDRKGDHVGPGDYIPWLTDRKWCYIRMGGTTFENTPLNCELKFEVWDAPNSAGVVIDAVRCAKLALDRGMAGALTAPSSYFMKTPPQQFADRQARELFEDFIRNRQPAHDRSNQAVEQTERPVALELSDGPEMARVFRSDDTGSSGHTPDMPAIAPGAGRDFAD